MKDNIILRDALLTDVCEIKKIEDSCFDDPWSEHIILCDLLSDDTYYAVIEKDGLLLGVAGYQNVVGQAHITTVAVLPMERKKGYAAVLLEALIKNTAENGIYDITLEVRASNKAAICLYEKFGFKIYGTRKKYYINNGEDAHIMWRFGEEKQRDVEK